MTLNWPGTAVFNPKVATFVQIKAPNKNDWTSLESIYEEIRAKNKRAYFTHSQMKKYQFRYRGKVYKYNDLENRKVYSLIIPCFCSPQLRSNYIFYTSKKNAYTIRLLDTIDRYLEKARFEALKAATIFDANYLNSNVSPKSYEWFYKQRCFYAENAIYSYYSTYEVLALIVWVSRSYMKPTDDTFDKVCRSCHSNDLRNRLYESQDELYPLLGDEEKRGNINPHFKQVIDWCNSFKHRGILRFSGEELENQPSTLFIPEINGLPSIENCCGSSDWKYKYIDLDDEVIPALVSYHEAIYLAAEKVVADILAKMGV